MPLDTQLVHVPFAGGLDEKTHSFLVKPGRFLKLHNAVRDKEGAVAQRTGHTKLATALFSGGNLLRGHGLAVLNDQLIVIGESSNLRQLHLWSTAANKWTRTGRVGRCTVSSKEVLPGSSRNIIAVDSVSDGNYTVFQWAEDGGTGRAALSDADGNVVKTSTLGLSGDMKPLCVRLNGKLCALRAVGSTITGTYADVADPNSAFSSSAAFVSGLHSNKAFDAIWDPTHDKALIAYVIDDSGTPRIRVGHLTTDVSGNLSVSGTVQHTDGTPVALALARDYASPGTILVAYLLSTGELKVVTVTDAANETLTIGSTASIETQSGIAQIAAGWDPSASLFRVFWDFTESGAIPQGGGEITKTWSANTSLGSVSAASVLKRGCAILARPFFRQSTSSDGGQYVIPLLRNSALQGTGLLVDNHTGVVVSRFMLGVCQRPESYSKARPSNVSPRVTSDAATNTWAKYRFAARRKLYVSVREVKGGIIIRDKFFDGVSQVDVDMDTRLYPSAKFGKSLIIAGDMPMVFDGKDVFELPFHHGPEQSQLGLTPTTGGVLKDGTYYYTFTYEYRDASGQLWRSLPMPVKSVTLSGGTSTQYFDVNVETLRATDISGDVAVVMWCTEANGTVLYRVGGPTDAPVASPAVDKPAINKTDAPTVTISRKGMADATLRKNEILYTTGGVLENVAPPNCRTIAVWRDRLILGGTDDSPTKLWFSKPYLEGVGAEFSDSQVLDLSNQGGQATGSEEIVGLGTLDEKLIILTKSQIFAMLGDGPDARGLGPGFQGPFSVDTSSGCKDPRSVVRIPQGLMFQAPAGIYLLDRSMAVRFIGAPVEDSLGSNVVVGAAIEPGETRCILRTAGGALVYDWSFDQWSTFDDLGGANVNPVGVAVWKDTAVMLNSDGVVWRSDSTVSTDDGVAYTPDIITAWLAFDGVAGFQRVKRVGLLGEKLDNFVLTVGVAYDFKDTEVATYSLDYSTLTTPLHQRIHLRDQKCRAIRFRLKHTTPGVAGRQRFVLSGMTLEVGLKKGLYKTSAARSLG